MRTEKKRGESGNVDDREWGEKIEKLEYS